MDKQYKSLMEQQNISSKVTAQFYEKVENAEHRRKPVRWKSALAAACIALIIPFTALAVENFFSTPKVKVGKLDWHDSPNGYSVQFDNLNNFPLDTFPKEFQLLSEHRIVPFDSWEDAANALGIDLLNSPLLSKARKVAVNYKIATDEEESEMHCKILYAQYNGQLSLVTASAHYLYDGLPLDLSAKLTVEHPELDTKMQLLLHGSEGVVNKPVGVKISYENYTTKTGIPVVILRFDRERVFQYTAFFAVNDISYELTAWVNPDRVEAGKQILLDVLDSFKLK